LKRVNPFSWSIPSFKLYFLAGKKENASINLLKPIMVRYIKIVKVMKTIREHVNPVCWFKELAIGIKTKTPNSQTRRAARKL